jgi:trehalose-phosphatase
VKEQKEALLVSPRDYDAVIFDLDGVVTRTASLHAEAWRRMFNEYLESRAARTGEPFRPFEIQTDYARYVDGKPRYEGVRSFLESRSIRLPWGTPEDPPGRETVCGLGNRKNELFHRLLETQGVETFESTIRLIRELRGAGVKTAIVSSSRNCADILKAAGIADLFDAKVDGSDSARKGLKGKPAPDIFVEAARMLGVERRRAAVVEDAIAGVQAGRSGNFKLVIGVDRLGQADDLLANGADNVVSDLAEVRVDRSHGGALPSALDRIGEILERLRDRRPAVFLDYDGTLTPIVARPEDAVISPAMRETVSKLARVCTVAVVSGRDLRDVRRLVGIPEILYAGSHGFEIAGPEGLNVRLERGEEFLPALDELEAVLRRRLDAIPGAQVERKRFSVAVHYRNAAPEDVEAVGQAALEAASRQPGLRVSRGKKVLDIQPGIDWNKGAALLWLLGALKLDTPETVPLYIGDDVTDEDAFRAIRERGIGIVVLDEERPSAARYALKNTEEVRAFLERLTA